MENKIYSPEKEKEKEKPIKNKISQFKRCDVGGIILCTTMQEK